MSPQIQKKQEWALASAALHDAYTDFILSRQAMLCSPATVKWYSFTLGKALTWLEEQGVAEPGEISARLVRQYLSSLAARNLSDSYIHSHARAVRTMLRFFHNESYITDPIVFQMPSIKQKRLPSLSAEEVRRAIRFAETPRDRMLVMFMVDTGARLGEVVAMNWGDVEIGSGLARIERGKGGKARSVVVGLKTRRALLKYRRLSIHGDGDPLFQVQDGGRLKITGLRSVLLRVGKRAGIHITPHMLRRTFAALSLRSGMNVLHLQGLLGHSSLEMTRRYIQLLEADLVEAHKEHGPIDNL